MTDERFADIADVVPAIIWLTDAAGACVYLNHRWTEFTGMPRALSVPASWRDAVHPDDEAQARPRIDEAFTQQRSFSVEYRMRRADGAYRWMLDRGRPRLDAAGSYAGHVGTVVDITERKLAEETLRNSESRFRSLAESAPHIMWALHRDGTLQFLNDRVTTITGLPPQSGRIQRWLRVLHADDIAPTIEAWRRAMRTERVFEIEHRLKHHTDTYCWYLTRAVPHRDASGAIRLWYGTSTDIHQLKTVESALRDKRERLDAALVASKTGTFRWDIKHDVVEWDDNLYRLCGLEPDGRVRTTADVLALIHPDDRGMIATGIDRIEREGLDFLHEFRVTWPDGTTHWLSHRSAIHHDELGVPSYSIGACTDITTRKSAELTLQDAKNESERASAAKDRFLAILSHELRTPLNPVKMVLDMLTVDDQLSDETRSLLDTARRNVDVQARLIDDLLDLTRIASGKLRVDRAELRLHDVIRNVIDICCTEIEKKHLTVTFDALAESDRLMADPARLRQVFWNLVRNAAKFARDGGTISITTSSASERVRVEVKDDGVGIDPQRVHQIFEPFAQEINDRREGLGLGLAISRSIVELHGGYIRAHSDGVGKGTTVVVELPVRGVPEPVSRSGGESGLRVLLVETDVKLREAIAMWLEARGYLVRQAWSAEEALRIADVFHPHVLVSDQNLPMMSGTDLVRALKRRYSIHAIAISASGNASDITNTLSAGFASYLIKPLDLDRLFAEISEYARRV